jgi:serine/threonine protein kinase
MPELVKYELLEEIGHGGMATVYLARDRRLGRDVAVKIIHRHLRENVEVATRFASEARAVAKLRHPNIVEVYDVSDEGEPERYLVVELVRGTTLRKLLTTHEYLPAEIAAIIAVEIASALDHAHQSGVIHRDVKPENVLVALPTPGVPSDARASAPDESVVKITDFGIAKLLDLQGVTSTGQVLGSPAHMAPEQIEGGDVNARSDVFGLGVMLYETMVGKLPFDGKNPAQVLRRVLDGQFTPADRARPTVGARFSAIVGRALAHDIGARYASAADLGAALREELDALGFVDLRAELRSFLCDPDAYRKAYEARIVERLVARGQEAREARDIQLSAASLNRALAFRPDDAELLSEVTSLGRAERLRRNVLSAALALGGSALIAVAAFGAVRVARTLFEPAPAASTSASARGLGPTQNPRPDVTDERPKLAEREDPKPPPPKPAVRIGPPRPTASASEVESQMATVRILVDGPRNASVVVDGTKLDSWFGQRTMSVGPHVFEFVPPNSECCKSGQRLEVEVHPPAHPGDVQIVKGRIEFKPATVEFTGTVGSSATCGDLGGPFSVPSRHTFPMDSPARAVHCTVLPPPTSGLSPKEFDVTLSPGRVSTISGP